MTAKGGIMREKGREAVNVKERGEQGVNTEL